MGLRKFKHWRKYTANTVLALITMGAIGIYNSYRELEGKESIFKFVDAIFYLQDSTNPYARFRSSMLERMIDARIEAEPSEDEVVRYLDFGAKKRAGIMQAMNIGFLED
ncbi:MAG: hypothetical protein HY514_04135 [Candidatus Aenigmarchaeota archaeon]|nr:hypothetical protein [Candidatus Aenigmarchaeota archaeon]